MKCSLGISHFLDEIFSLPHSIVFFYFFALIAEEGLLSPLSILWNSAFKWAYLSFSPLPLASLLFTAICKASSDNHFASKVMLKILQARLQQYVNPELPDVQARFRKARGTTDQIANIHWIMKNAREFQKYKMDLGKAEEPEIKLTTSIGSSKKRESSRKTSVFALLTMSKPLTVWITINCGKF